MTIEDLSENGSQESVFPEREISSERLSLRSDFDHFNRKPLWQKAEAPGKKAGLIVTADQRQPIYIMRLYAFMLHKASRVNSFICIQRQRIKDSDYFRYETYLSGE